jgi:hypothetical protein
MKFLNKVILNIKIIFKIIMNILYLIIICIIIFLTFRYSNFENYNKKKDEIINKYDEFCKTVPILTHKKYKKIIFTVTTFFDFKKEDKWLVFCNSMDSILYYHPNIYLFIDFYIINEFSNEPRADWNQIINQKYPFINFVQKTEDFKGQGESLNLILTMIKSYIYWIHWEEAWYITREFLFDAIKIMDNTKLSQLQFTKEGNHTHWIEKAEQQYCHFLPNNNGYCIINYNIEDYPKINLDREFTHDDWMKVKWPLYSIRPSINRVKDYKIGLFLINPQYWPLKFEIEFGERWMRYKNKKGIFIEGPVTRKSTHISTYH